MAGVYRPRHPERTVLYRVLFHHFDTFLKEYESRFEREYGFCRPIVKEVVERYLDCGNPRCGFARIRCPDCREERLVMFSCRTRGFCPSCHAKRIGVIAAIQTFGDRINLHVHLHFLATEGGVDEAGIFHKIPRIDDLRLAEIFAREVLSMLVRKELLSPEWTERILSWPHTGFNVHSLVRAKTKPEAERVGKYMIRPVLALERLTFLEPEGKVCYRCGLIWSLSPG
jgi:ribosomal protein S27E